MKKMIIAMMILSGAVMAAPQPGKPMPPPGGTRPGQPGMAQRGVPAGGMQRRAARPQRAKHGEGERMSESEKKLEYIAQLEEKGRRVLPQIAAYICDSSEEVSEEAYRVWSTMVDQMDYQLRAEAVLQAADALRQAGFGRR